MTLKATKERAKNRWTSILTVFGFTKSQLCGAHQACPICGGKDRWRYSNYDGNGSYYCSGCGPGSGFDLLMKTQGWDFKEAAAEVDKLIGEEAVRMDSANQIFEPERNTEKNRKALNDLWSQGLALPNGAADIYLKTRSLGGLMEARPSLFRDCRYNPSMYHKQTGDRVPGLMWLIRNPAGRPVSIHRTFFKPRDKKIMPPTEPLKGSSIRLGEGSRRLVIGEGIETTLSGCKWFECDGLASISANMMEELKQLPNCVEEVIILSDNDRSFTGQKAAFTLARQLDNRKDLRRVVVVMPKNRGEDFNDIRPVASCDLPYIGWSNG